MDLRIADTFTDSLARLTNEEQKAVKTTAFDLQMDSSAPRNLNTRHVYERLFTGWLGPSCPELLQRSGRSTTVGALTSRYTSSTTLTL